MSNLRVTPDMDSFIDATATAMLDDFLIDSSDHEALVNWLRTVWLAAQGEPHGDVDIVPLPKGQFGVGDPL